LNVISDLIGIPPRDRTRFYAWTQSLSAGVQVDFSTLHPQRRAELNQSAKDMEAYFQTQTQNMGERDPSSLMDTFIAGNESRMDTVQLLANCAFLLFAGQETTTSLLSNAMAALLEHPDQLDLLRRRPELIENSVEECLRYDPSIQMVGRHALDDIQLGEHVIAKGAHVFAFIGAAGRDPAVCYEPDRFEVDRDPIKHLAFARGTHHCLGALLARLEIKIMLEELLSSFAVLERAGPAQRRSTWLMRGFESLPVRCGHD
jgi:cytochrome P450